MKFSVGDMVVSTRNRSLTYKILQVGLLNELGEPDYCVEIFVDGKNGSVAQNLFGDKSWNEHNIQFISCAKMDEWGELVI